MVRPTSLPFLVCSFALIALGALASSCSVLIDTKTTQCDVDADCKALSSGGGDGAGFTCSDHVCVAPPAKECVTNEDCSAKNNDFGDATCDDDGVCVEAQAPVLVEAKGCMEPTKSTDATVTLSFELLLTIEPKDPKPPFTVHTCRMTDPNCDSPGPDIEVPYGELAKIPVKPGVKPGDPDKFYLEIRHPDGLPAMEFLGRPINEDTTGYGLTIPTPASVASLVAFTQETYNAERGVFVVTTRDCDRLPLAGVAVSNTLGGTPFIFDSRIPQKSLTETTKDGAAGFVNVPAGFPILSAVLNGTQKMSNTTAISRGGWVTYVEMFP